MRTNRAIAAHDESSFYAGLRNGLMSGALQLKYSIFLTHSLSTPLKAGANMTHRNRRQFLAGVLNSLFPANRQLINASYDARKRVPSLPERASVVKGLLASIFAQALRKSPARAFCDSAWLLMNFG